MAQNQANATSVPPRPARPAPWPDNEVRGVESDARAVVAEAYAVEREAGGSPFAGVTFDDLRQAAQDLTELCEALQSEDLNDEQRQLLADVAPKIEALAAELSGESPDDDTLEELLEAAESLKKRCDALLREELDDDLRRVLVEFTPALDNLISTIRAFEQGQGGGKPERRASADTQPRGGKK